MPEETFRLSQPLTLCLWIVEVKEQLDFLFLRCFPFFYVSQCSGTDQVGPLSLRDPLVSAFPVVGFQAGSPCLYFLC